MGVVGEFKLLNSKVIKFVKDPILILIYLVGVVWFFLLSHESLNASTYFSENALLPGLVDSEVYFDYGASQMSDELDALLKKRKADHNYEIPSEWLLDKFRKQGVQAYTQNYTFSYPHGVYSELKDAMKGTNIYTIIRAPRASSTEAIVINIPFHNHPSNNDQASNHPAIALIIALSKAFRKKSYWAKDLVFVVSDNNEVGLQAWLSSYHHVPNQYIKAQMLPARSGVIQAALVLELQGKVNGHFTVKTEGMNGKLPNLDLFNTVERLFSKEGARIHLLEAHKQWLMQLRSSRRWQQLVNMLNMLWHLASNYPSGNHGYFSPYGIEAATIKGVERRKARQFELADVARVIEGTLRSLNNLLERFHQSFFFYLLASSHRYISIGVYLPPIGLMLLPILIKVLKVKLDILESSKEEGAEKGEDAEKESQKKKDEETKKEDEEKKKEDYEKKDEAVENEDDMKTSKKTLRNRFNPKQSNAAKEIEEEKNSNNKTESSTKEKSTHNKGKNKEKSSLNKENTNEKSSLNKEESKEKSSLNKEETKKKSSLNKEETQEKSSLNKEETDESLKNGSTNGSNLVNTSLSALFLHSCMAVCIPVSFYYSSDLFIRSSVKFMVETEDSLTLCLIISHLTIIAYPLIFNWHSRKNPLPVEHKHLHLLSLICMGIICGILSVVNVSLSFLVLLFWSPLVVLINPTRSYRIFTVIKAAFLLLLSPACLLYAATFVNLYIASKATMPSCSAVFGNLGDGLMSSMLYYNLHNLWSFPLIYFLFLPMWSLMWFTAFV